LPRVASDNSVIRLGQSQTSCYIKVFME
jgi:hypothetical protein